MLQSTKKRKAPPSGTKRGKRRSLRKRISLFERWSRGEIKTREFEELLKKKSD